MSRIQTDFFDLIMPETIAEAAGFAPWLLNAGRAREKVAMCVRDERLFFATSKEVWASPLEGDVFFAVLAGFRQQAIDIPQVAFVARDLYTDIIEICTTLAEPLGFTPPELFERLAPLFEGDLRSASQTIGWEIEGHGSYSDGANDAYGTVIHEEQYALGIARYYDSLGVPFAKLQAEATLHGNPRPDWYVTYEDLWIRVAVHYTGDPTLKWAFQEERNPWVTAAKMLDTSQETARALLVWQIYGRDMNLIQHNMPDVVAALPMDLPLWGVRMDKAMPAFCAGISQMQNAYWQNRRATTLYGRILRPGKDPGEASAFVIFGTVEDILVNAAVTLWNNRTSRDIFISKIDGGPNSDLVRIGGSMPAGGLDQWRYAARQLSPLNNPLTSGPLRPSFLEV